MRFKMLLMVATRAMGIVANATALGARVCHGRLFVLLLPTL